MEKLVFSVEVLKPDASTFLTAKGTKLQPFEFVEEWNEVKSETVERTCLRYHEQFKALAPESQIYIDVRMRSGETWPTFYSYYGVENRFIIHT